MNRLCAVFAAFALMAASACGGEDAFTAKGTIGLVQPDAFTKTYDKKCAGKGGYSDIREGAAVVIYNSKGDKVGLGELAEGTSEKNGPCVFKFAVDEIPVDDGLFSVEVSSRGQVTFKREKAHAIVLSLG